MDLKGLRLNILTRDYFQTTSCYGTAHCSHLGTFAHLRNRTLLQRLLLECCITGCVGNDAASLHVLSDPLFHSYMRNPTAVYT